MKNQIQTFYSVFEALADKGKPFERMGHKATDLTVDFGIRIWDCGIESFFNPHSTICNPQSAYGGWATEVG